MRIIFVYAHTPDAQEIRSPFSITRNLHAYLAKRAHVKYYQWDRRGVADLEPDDVFLGHPHYDKNTIVQRTFREKRCRVMCTIHPLHTADPQYNMPFDHLARQADKIFSICGPYWIDTIHDTRFAHWAPKITRLDMAVDASVWKYRKHNFNKPGQRGIVYVGSSMPMKNLGYLYKIAAAMPDVPFRWYGGSSDHQLNRLPNVKVIGWCDFRNSKILRELHAFGDILINVSTSDANPTTLLEFGLAGGLLPVCTKTSGYWRDKSFINIPVNDVGGAVAILREWLQKPSEDLQKLSNYNRAICEEKYTWERFCKTVWDGINDIY